MSYTPRFINLLYEKGSVCYSMPLHMHISMQHVDWFSAREESFVKECKLTIIKLSKDFSMDEDSTKKVFQFAVSEHMKLVYQVSKNRIAHVVLVGEQSLALRSTPFEVRVWMFPLEADIPIEFISV
jgi:hypothetical protein